MISFANVSKQYGKQILFVEASFQLNPGEKAGLVGPNGAGKTTIFNMLTGVYKPTEGAIIAFLNRSRISEFDTGSQWKWRTSRLHLNNFSNSARNSSLNSGFFTQ